jgi:hypothetical protein
MTSKLGSECSLSMGNQGQEPHLTPKHLTELVCQVKYM